MPLDTCFLAPFEEGHTGHLRSVVRDDRLRLSPSGDEAIQLASKPSARQGCVCDQAQAFPGEVVDGGARLAAHMLTKARAVKAGREERLGLSL